MQTDYFAGMHPAASPGSTIRRMAIVAPPPYVAPKFGRCVIGVDDLLLSKCVYGYVSTSCAAVLERMGDRMTLGRRVTRRWERRRGDGRCFGEEGRDAEACVRTPVRQFGVGERRRKRGTMRA